MSFLRNAKGRIAVLLLFYALALGWEAWRLGVTFDEPSHLAAAYMYWRGQDVLYPSDTPPLMRMVSGWAPRVLKTPLPQDRPGWKDQSSFDIGMQILEAQNARQAHRLIFLTRLPFLIFPLLTVWLLWYWARQLFSERTALLVAVCAMLEPTLLGHGVLIKSDVAAAFGCLLFFYLAWRYWRRPDLVRVLALSCGLLVAVLAKFTLLALIPVAVALVVWRGPRFIGTVMVLGTVYLGLLAAYQLQVRPIEKKELEEMREEGFGRREVAAARLLRRLPWPPQFVQGVRYIGKADRSEGFPAYMLGRKIEYGAPGYFPLAWWVKFPVALQLLAVAGLAAVAVRLVRREAAAAEAFVWGPPALLLALAMRSHIHIGFRHLLPALLFLILGAGFAIDRWASRRAFRVVLTACLIWLAAASGRVYPQGISYFNEWAGGSEEGWKYLADSNLDWGQNLPELARYVAENGVQKINLCYFGLDIPSHHIPPERLEVLAPPFESKWVHTTRLRPPPGVYAISVNFLLGFFFSPEYRDYFTYFRVRQPAARAGYSIFIYYVK